jgi:hypothetical protein
MSSRIRSFTEYALLNRWALDCLSPSDFQKRRVASTGQSALQILKDVKINPYSNLKNSSFLYYANKFFISTPLKIAYIAGVTLTLSRLGVVMNGFFTVYSYCKYKITASGNTFEVWKKTDEAWKKTKGYAFAFFADLSSAVVGAFLTKVVVESAFWTLHFCQIGSWMGGTSRLSLTTASCLIISIALVALGCAGLISLQSPSVAPQFYVMPQDRVGMYLSLSLRKGLGIVSEKGDHLPFSEEDQLKYTETRENEKNYYQFNGANYSTLKRLIIDAEWELLETVQECQKYFPDKISCQYPFKGEVVARILEDQLKTSSAKSSKAELSLATDTSPIYRLSAQLRSLAKKIEVLNEIFTTSQKLTVNDSIPVWIMKALARISSPDIEFETTPSFIPRREYENYYNRQSCSPGGNSSSVQNPLEEIEWDTFDIPLINPEFKRPESEIVDKFRYDIGVTKWKIQEKKKVMPLKGFFGLSKDASYRDYTQERRRYCLQIHPDKNKAQDATELFKCLNAIIEKVNQEYNQT